ncbi:MAG TPA: GTP-binding protein [Burkholderiales bacterium]|nr:GTP-binding protein [Burkholderiales bacterium]
MSPLAKVPVTLFTGFLGSGKTTLLNRILAAPQYADSAVIINEFGAISIDHLLVATPRENMVVLESGCVCCTVQGELVDTLIDLMRQRGKNGVPAFRRVLVETTGLADPIPILEVLAAHPDIPVYYALHSVVTLVDGVNALGQLEEFRESRRQVAVADRLLISKSDLTDAQALAALETKLAELNADAPRLTIDPRTADTRLLFGTAYLDIAQGRGDVSEWLRDGLSARTRGGFVAHTGNVQTFSIRHEGPVTRAGLVLWLDLIAGLKGRDLLRVKGVFNVEGEPVAVHAVQRIVHEPAPLPAWPDEERASRIVFITRGIPREAIEQTLDVLGYVAPAANRATLDPDAYARFVAAVGKFH